MLAEICEVLRETSIEPFIFLVAFSNAISEHLGEKLVFDKFCLVDFKQSASVCGNITGTQLIRLTLASAKKFYNYHLPHLS